MKYTTSISYLQRKLGYAGKIKNISLSYDKNNDEVVLIVETEQDKESLLYNNHKL